jgi:hypothetical protein
MTRLLGESKSINVGNGIVGHLGRLPGERLWGIKSCDCAHEFRFRRIFAEEAGWAERGFDTAEEAGDFIARRVRWCLNFRGQVAVQLL